MDKENYTIDATGKRLGAVATEAASYLIGKNRTDFARNVVPDITVTITNASKLDISERRATEIYQRYSGYPGGLKSETLEHLRTRRGIEEPLRRTISGMMPKNKLRNVRLKNLIITA